MFPIKDTQGRVLGFGGRTVVDDPAKYLNSPETEIYHKSSCWYGLHEARAYHDEMMVVEGYLDVVSLAQYGVREAVASCGTATRTAQLALLTRRVKTVVCCFDGDNAGRAAAWRALKAALPLVQDASFQFLFLPQDEDPDSLIRKWGADRFREWSAANRINLEDLLLNGLADKYDMQTIAGKQSFLQEIAEHLALMPRGIFYHLMVERISELTHLNVAELVSGKRDSVGNRREAAADSLNASSGHTADKKEFSADCHMLIAHLAKLLLCHPSLTERVLKEQELIKEFAGGKELNELAKWIGQMGADRVNLGMIVEHERDTKLAPILREASSLFMRMDKAADGQNEAARMDGGEVDFLNLVRSMRSKLNNDLIEQLIKKANQQQLSMEEKLKLQALIQENKSSLSS